MDNESYNKLFEIVDKNMQQSGKKIDHRRAAFFYYINKDPYVIDIMELLEIKASNDEFIDIAYIYFFDRLADESALEYYKKFLLLSPLEFRCKIMYDLRNSQEFKSTGKKILNITDKSENRESKNQLEKIMVHILPVYKRLPNGIKNRIKRIIGVGEK